ncbi:C40 family peptidase [Pontibacter sp. SGAir0037]|uniref:C40 family peptidase n=1 Tax=Pontibacter sp. SGAir0037 TaxID=2571030 RepID=UPI0010CCEEA5|nr:C40 family peptidase [Pontibacter sp. SGAir0037]QCR21824.1 NlpC/P60 family protein [Pontibacter sp. SGAir0037]
MKKLIALVLSPLPLLYFSLESELDKPLHLHPDKPASKVETNMVASAGELNTDFSGFRSPDSDKDAKSRRKQLVHFATQLIGSPYIYAGTTPNGFDCSGFTTYVYENFGIDVGRSSAMQSGDGIEIDRSEARRGDLLIFTGTNLQVREPGHVGIVISSPGEDTIKFVHSSSNGGVKISSVEGTRYNDRLLQVRRVF